MGFVTNDIYTFATVQQNRPSVLIARWSEIDVGSAQRPHRAKAEEHSHFVEFFLIAFFWPLGLPQLSSFTLKRIGRSSCTPAPSSKMVPEVTRCSIIKFYLTIEH